ncbi:hypothetical protein O59_001158 [Cellvibrio sp. BR]|jgi:hypothetical protein|uniref:hypothetical protein n=1 Tax=unclassified Cellvibrio TaxID=2624793 RepID=UPI0002600E8B|nr:MULTISPECIES: hypothetical protein [unclassified Cellvibrio]EIK42877.1 hypothetical protein O59_001158 [Cellvibrio sp. BR]QEY14111.1 hypothetical protein D0B88_18695 [Cellvibrio sp. KY-YJ-3]UUA74734.1 hypothetical protein NNX04_09890 [Cellvibrio sp. QJXJ]
MKKYVIALTLTAALSSGAYACSKPATKPEFPDPATAVSAQMVKANNDVKAYVKAMQDYLGCAGLSRSAEKKELDDLKAYAESFNVIIRAYKAKAG